VSAEHASQIDAIEQQVEEIISAGALGKSDAYARLLRFLAERAHTQKSVKEIEIAIEVFGRDETFDVTQDSLVRVYIHKLRTKLNNFYDDAGANYTKRLSIPKGSYLLGLESNDAPSSGPQPLKRIITPERTILVAASLVIGICIALAAQYLAVQYENESVVIESEIWLPLAEDERPLLVVVGDVFVFSEVTPEFEQLREIRDFSISSNQEFLSRRESDQGFMEVYRDYGVRYLPSAIASSLLDLSDFLGAHRPWSVRLASQLESLDLDQFNIIYLGYYTGLNQFEDAVFLDSKLQLHPNGSVLIQSESGEIFVGDGQVAEGYRDRYLDYAMLRKVRLANGSTLIALMSARDAGLENLAAFAFSLEGTEAIASQLENPEASFEMLLEVSGNESDYLISQIRMIQQSVD
jgi:hypothetical protein